MIGLLSEYLFVLGAKGKAFWESDTSINLFICNIGSYFLSSSKDLNVANEFSNCGIIIVGWVPKVDSNYQLIRYTDIYSKHEEIEKLGFTVLSPQYPEEKEICLKCGMLPHFMLGYIVLM